MRAYWQQENNFGDKLTPYLVKKLVGRDCILKKTPGKLLGVGSILHWAMEGDTIWGSGLISPRHLPKSNKLNVLALRGPMTADILSKLGVDTKNCIYGDPGLLLSRVYKPRVSIEYPIGIVPHYVDVEIAKKEYPNCHLIDVTLPIEKFIDEINKCGRILSSSLHGLVTADSYGIPNDRMVLSNNLMGGNFKFLDYYLGKNRFKAEQMIARLNSYVSTL